MNDVLRVYGIVKESIVDGPGIRYVVFVQGCPHKCAGCHNQASHDFKKGYDVSIDELFEDIKKNPLLSGVTFSGGEPFCQAAELCRLADKIRMLNKTIYTFTGYTFEELLGNAEHRELLKRTDVLIDGKFVEELKDYHLEFKGSSNQRIIYVKKELEMFLGTSA